MSDIWERFYCAWKLPAKEITDRAEKLMEKTQTLYKEVGTLAPSDADTNNVLMVRFSLQLR